MPCHRSISVPTVSCLVSLVLLASIVDITSVYHGCYRWNAAAHSSKRLQYLTRHNDGTLSGHRFHRTQTSPVLTRPLTNALNPPSQTHGADAEDEVLVSYQCELIISSGSTPPISVDWPQLWIVLLTWPRCLSSSWQVMRTRESTKDVEIKRPAWRWCTPALTASQSAAGYSSQGQPVCMGLQIQMKLIYQHVANLATLACSPTERLPASQIQPAC